MFAGLTRTAPSFFSREGSLNQFSAPSTFGRQFRDDVLLLTAWRPLAIRERGRNLVEGFGFAAGRKRTDLCWHMAWRIWSSSRSSLRSSRQHDGESVGAASSTADRTASPHAGTGRSDQKQGLLRRQDLKFFIEQRSHAPARFEFKVTPGPGFLSESGISSYGFIRTGIGQRVKAADGLCRGCVRGTLAEEVLNLLPRPRAVSSLG